jgi:hypothetical protein
MVVLRGRAVSYERGTPVPPHGPCSPWSDSEGADVSGLRRVQFPSGSEAPTKRTRLVPMSEFVPDLFAPFPSDQGAAAAPGPKPYTRLLPVFAEWGGGGSLHLTASPTPLSSGHGT